MDSRLLYIVANKHKARIDGISNGNGKYIHFGIGEALNVAIVEEITTKYFGNSEVYLIYERENSGSLKNAEISELFLSILGKENFYLIDKGFTKAIDFANIGVLKYFD